MEWAGGIPVTFDRFGTRGILDSHLCGAHRSRGVDIASSGRVPERMWHAHAGARKLASRHPAAVRGRRMRALRTLAGRRMHIAVGKGLGKQTTRAEKALCCNGVASLPQRKSVDGFFEIQNRHCSRMDHAHRYFGCDVHYGMRRGGLRIVSERRCSYPAEGVCHARREWCPVGS